MFGHPLLDFIMFVQFFNGDKISSSGSSGGGNVGGKWSLIIAFAIFAIIVIYCLIADLS